MGETREIETSLDITILIHFLHQNLSKCFYINLIKKYHSIPSLAALNESLKHNYKLAIFMQFLMYKGSIFIFYL